MPIPQNKQELSEAIRKSYDKLKQDLKRVPAHLSNQKELDGHAKDTVMSVADLIAYLLGWGELVIKWHKKKELNEQIDWPETGYKWNELGLLAQKFYQDYGHLDYPALLKNLDKTVDQLLNIIEITSDEDLYHKPWYDKWPQGRMIQLNTSSPYKNTRTRLRKWLKSKDL